MTYNSIQPDKLASSDFRIYPDWETFPEFVCLSREAEMNISLS